MPNLSLGALLVFFFSSVAIAIDGSSSSDSGILQQKESAKAETRRIEMIPRECRNPMNLEKIMQWNVDRLRWEFPSDLRDKVGKRSAAVMEKGEASRSGGDGGSSLQSEDDELRLRCSSFIRRPFSTYSALVDLLRGRHLLFVGDSTVRNQVNSLVGMLVNPLSYDECGDRPWNHFWCNSSNSKTASILSEEKNFPDLVTSDDPDLTLESKGMYSYRKIRDEMQTFHIGLLGLTEVFSFENPWSHRKAVVAAHYLFPSIDFRVTYITTGCAEDQSNSVYRAFDYFARLRKRQANSSTTTSSQNNPSNDSGVYGEGDNLTTATTRHNKRAFIRETDVASSNTSSHENPSVLEDDRHDLKGIQKFNTSKLPFFDAILTSMMFHCDLGVWQKSFANGDSRDRGTSNHLSPWARTSRVIRSLRKVSPFTENILFLESPHCLRQEVCPLWHETDIKFRRQYLQPQGPHHRSAIPVVPQYFWTRNANLSADGYHSYDPRERKLLSLEYGKTCIFYDKMHAGLACLRDGTTVLLAALRMIGAL